jgi:hypothetical protein
MKPEFMKPIQSPIHEASLFDMILDPRGLQEREGGFRGRGVRRFEPAKGVRQTGTGISRFAQDSPSKFREK